MFLRGRHAGLHKCQTYNRTARADQILRRRDRSRAQVINKGNRQMVKSSKKRLTVNTLRLNNAKLHNRTMTVGLSRNIMTVQGKLRNVRRLDNRLLVSRTDNLTLIFNITIVQLSSKLLLLRSLVNGNNRSITRLRNVSHMSLARRRNITDSHVPYQKENRRTAKLTERVRSHKLSSTRLNRMFMPLLVHMTVTNRSRTSVQ